MLVLSVLFSFAAVGCVLPPDGSAPGDGSNRAPEILLDTITPKPSLLTVTIDECTSFDIGAKIRDRDSDILNIRVVTNNGLNDTHFFRNRLAPAEGPELFDVDEPIAPDKAFPALYARLKNSALTTETGILSLFVTDSPAWAIPNPTPADYPAGRDLGRIPTLPDDPGAYHVAEIRWAVKLTSEEPQQCP